MQTNKKSLKHGAVIGWEENNKIQNSSEKSHSNFKSSEKSDKNNDFRLTVTRIQTRAQFLPAADDDHD